jgi:hypothetical protein
MSCHSGGDPEGNLSLASRAGWEAAGVIQPGAPSESLLFQAIRRDKEEIAMPPVGKGKQLSQRQIADVERWIREGAFDPRQDGPTTGVGPKKRNRIFEITDDDRNHWAFQPLVRVPTRAGETDSEIIDRLVLQKLDRIGATPNPLASPRELVRRVYLDLWGLPPSYDDVMNFANEPSDRAWRQVVDKLLDSHHYGERWGRHWLDWVRFAETNGYERDGPKPNAWRYRDYVIGSLNQDKPYGRFLTEQLAGDELIDLEGLSLESHFDRWRDAIAATGFYRLHVWDDEPDSSEAAEMDDLDDIMVTIGASMLSLTIGCARCHDHKYDPISQRDYYSFLAHLSDIDPYGQFKKGGGGRGTGRIQRWLVPESSIQAWEQERAARRSVLEQELAQSTEEKRQKELKESIKVCNNEKPPFEAALAIHKRNQPKTIHVLFRGDWKEPRDTVSATIPILFQKNHLLQTTTASKNQTAFMDRPRFALAQWITDSQNPLTYRSIVNRVWQQHFGQGIVDSPDDFGATGTQPTHAELLDFLASRLIASGGSIKELHRIILNSQTYRRSSQMSSDPSHPDLENRFFGRQNLRRVDAEIIRDSILRYTRSLTEKKDGPSVTPQISKEVLDAANPATLSAWKPSAPEEQNCRSVFLLVKRSLKLPLLEAFDFANSHSPTMKRLPTITAPQSLVLLNDSWIQEHAQKLILDTNSLETTDRIRKLWRTVFQRDPTSDECELVDSFLSETGPTSQEDRWISIARALFNSNEALFLD